MTDTRMKWPDRYGRVILHEIDSTNAEAARRIGDLSGPTWIMARMQTAARGRRGRPWANPEGNFAATLVLRHPGAPGQAALRSFTAALALHEAFVTATGRPGSFALKWPNDVLLNGGKVAGILLEGLHHGTGAHAQAGLAIGIGVNLAAAPDPGQVEPGALRPVSLLSETGTAIDPEEFLNILAPAYARLESQFASYGFAPLRAAWLERAARLGEPVTARMGSETVTGTFETIDETGQLVLRGSHGVRRITAAEIFF